MAAGVPVVVPKLGLFPELIELTGGGVLLPTVEPATVAAALAELMDDPDRADVMGRRAAAGVARHFSAEKMAEQTLKAYERALGTSSGEGGGNRI